MTLAVKINQSINQSINPHMSNLWYFSLGFTYILIVDSVQAL